MGLRNSIVYELKFEFSLLNELRDKIKFYNIFTVKKFIK
jgi:hypothetical protein